MRALNRNGYKWYNLVEYVLKMEWPLEENGGLVMILHQIHKRIQSKRSQEEKLQPENLACNHTRVNRFRFEIK